MPLQIKVTAHPNSRHPRIRQDIFGHLDVYITAPAEGGRGNNAVVKAISAYYNVKESDVLLVSGETTRRKIFIVQAPCE